MCVFHIYNLSSGQSLCTFCNVFKLLYHCHFFKKCFMSKKRVKELLDVSFDTQVETFVKSTGSDRVEQKYVFASCKFTLIVL